MSNQCVGCESYLGNSCRLGISSNINGIKCPCSTCLVKSMCNGSICDVFIEYAERSQSIYPHSFNPILYRLKQKGFKWRRTGERESYFNNRMIREAMKEEENERNK